VKNDGVFLEEFKSRVLLRRSRVCMRTTHD